MGKRTKFVLIIFAIIFSLSSLFFYFFYKKATKNKFEEMRRNMTSVAVSAAMAVDEQKHSKILTAKDMTSPEYLQTKEILKKFKDNHPYIRYIYTMRKTNKPNIWKFVVDASEPKDDNGDGVISELEKVTPVGEEYDVSKYPEMQKAFEGPIADKTIDRDKWGWWLSAYAPIYNSKNEPTAIVGVDVSAKTIEEEYLKLRKRIIVMFGLSIILSLIIEIAWGKS